MEARGRLPPPIEDLEVIRTEAGMPITRFAELIGMPRRTYTRHRSRWLAGDPVKGPWGPREHAPTLQPLVAPDSDSTSNQEATREAGCRPGAARRDVVIW